MGVKSRFFQFISCLSVIHLQSYVLVNDNFTVIFLLALKVDCMVCTVANCKRMPHPMKSLTRK